MDISSSPNQRWLAKEFASSLEQTHRSTRHDVHGYVEFAKHLGETEGPEPDPEFRAALRHRLLHELIEDELLPQDELAIRRERAPRRKGGSHCFERAPREPWIAAASTVLVVCGGAIGLSQESSEALPTDSLYPVKRFFEAGEMAVAGSPADQARELMEQAAERLDEARQLVTTDEVHAQQALPATITDFSEATADAGELVIDLGQVDGPDAEAATLVAEFHSFSLAAHAALDDIADDADPETAALISDARSTLDGIDAQLPTGSILDAVADVSTAADDVTTMLGLSGGQHEGTGLTAMSSDEANVGTVPLTGDDGGNVVETVEAVTEPLDGATSALETSVSVVELAANDTVSVAVATVNTTVETVHNTVRTTVETTKQAIDQTVKATDQAVRDTVNTAKQTVEQTTKAVGDTVKAVDHTVRQATDTLQQTTESLQQATDTLQQTTESLQQATDGLQSALGSGPETPAHPEAPADSATDSTNAQDAVNDLVEDSVGGLQSTTDRILSTQTTS